MAKKMQSSLKMLSFSAPKNCVALSQLNDLLKLFLAADSSASDKIEGALNGLLPAEVPRHNMSRIGLA